MIKKTVSGPEQFDKYKQNKVNRKIKITILGNIGISGKSDIAFRCILASN